MTGQLASIVVLIAIGAAAVAVTSSLVAPRSPLASVRTRLLLAIGAFAVVMFAGMISASAAPELLGTPLVTAPGVAAATALLVFAAPGRRRTAAASRAASLTPRPLVSGSVVRAARAPIALTAALVALIVATGCTASPDSFGLSRALTMRAGSISSTTSPYPGWFYGLPVLVAVAVLAASAMIAIARIRLLPATGTDDAADARWRTTVAVALARIASSALLCYLTGLAFGTATAVSNAVTGVRINGGGAAPGLDALGATGTVLDVLAIACALAAIIAFIDALVRSASLADRPLPMRFGGVR